MKKIRLLLLDDHILFRESLGRLLSAEHDFEIVGQCGSVEEALAVLKTNKPDLVLLDFDLGEDRGSGFLARAREVCFNGRILVVTAGVSDTTTLQLLEQGVSGIFFKHSSPSHLAEAIRKVTEGEVWVDQRTLKAIVRAVGQSKETGGNTGRFTEREQSILKAVLDGLSNKEIGDRLDLSEASVKASIQQLFRKTGVRTRSQLVRIALEQNAGK